MSKDKLSFDNNGRISVDVDKLAQSPKFQQALKDCAALRVSAPTQPGDDQRESAVSEVSSDRDLCKVSPSAAANPVAVVAERVGSAHSTDKPTGDTKIQSDSHPSTQPGDAVALLRWAEENAMDVYDSNGKCEGDAILMSDLRAHLSSAQSAGAQEEQELPPTSEYVRGLDDALRIVSEYLYHGPSKPLQQAIDDLTKYMEASAALPYAAASAKAQWQPIETAPKDNKIPLLLARFNDDGSLQSIDYNGIWESDRESWEIPERYWYWASAHGNVEEPSHWMYQPEWYAHLPAAASETARRVRQMSEPEIAGYACVYCGNLFESYDDPSVIHCCGEVGHVEVEYVPEQENEALFGRVAGWGLPLINKETP